MEASHESPSACHGTRVPLTPPPHDHKPRQIYRDATHLNMSTQNLSKQKIKSVTDNKRRKKLQIHSKSAATSATAPIYSPLPCQCLYLAAPFPTPATHFVCTVHSVMLWMQLQLSPTHMTQIHTGRTLPGMNQRL